MYCKTRTYLDEYLRQLRRYKSISCVCNWNAAKDGNNFNSEIKMVISRLYFEKEEFEGSKNDRNSSDKGDILDKLVDLRRNERIFTWRPTTLVPPSRY